MFDLLAAGDAVREQMKSSIDIETPARRAHVRKEERGRLSVLRAVPSVATRAARSIRASRGETGREACSEGAGQ
jgi:hypothetical protein